LDISCRSPFCVPFQGYSSLVPTTTIVTQGDLNAQFKIEFRKYLPYAYCFRFDKDPKSNELKKLMSLDINLCSNIKVLYKDKETFIEDFEYVEYDRNKVCIKTPSHVPSLKHLQGIFEFCDTVAEIISSSIDVEGNRKDYRELFAKYDDDRRKTILSDFDNPGLLKEIKKLFLQEYSDLNQFWVDIMKSLMLEVQDKTYTEKEVADILKIEKSLIEKINLKVNFEDLCQVENAPYFIELFSALNIDIADYNGVADNEISVCAYYDKRFEEIKSQYLNSYFTVLYNNLRRNIELNEKQKFIQQQNDFINGRIDFKNSVKVNIKELLFDRFSNLEVIETVDLGPIYFENKKQLKQLLGTDEAQLEDFLHNPLYDSLLFFGENEELQKLFKKFLNKEKESEAKYSGESLKDVMKNIKANQYRFEEVSDTFAPKNESTPIIKTKLSAGLGGVKSNNTEKIGLKGERYVYAMLKNEYSQVDWVSENARVDGINALGAAGYGYDMTFLDENNKKIYVEVKTTTGDEETFYISSNELDFAERNGQNYEIILATNINDPSKKFYRYKALFLYSDNETRFYNNKFKLDAKEYKVYTRKVDK